MTVGAQILMAALLFAGGSQATSIVNGVVQESDGRRVRPLNKATVLALAPDGKKVLATARTDAKGRFQMPILISGRIALHVEKAGFLPAHNTEQGDIGRMLDCSREGSCESLSMEMIRAGVVTGNIVDELGEPFASVNVTLMRGENRAGRQLRSRTDDRGEFRIANIAPGDYTLTTASSYRGLDNSIYEGRPLELEVASGQLIDGLRVVLVQSAGGGFRVSGSVTGVELSGDVRSFIQVRGLGDATRRRLQVGVRNQSVNKDGGFTFDKIPEGRYIITLQQVRGTANVARRGRSQRFTLGTLEVSGDVDGLNLSPLPATGLKGRIVHLEASLGKPVLLGLRGERGMFSQIRVLSGDADGFSSLQMLPDKYTIRAQGRDYFVHAVIEDEERWADNSVDLGVGQIRNVEIVLSRDFAEVSGRVKSPQDGSLGAFYRVALRGRNGVTSVQADQDAYFLFEGIVPGDYEICAWADADAVAVREDEIWVEAGSSVRAFPVDAGAGIEIGLTAAK